MLIFEILLRSPAATPLGLLHLLFADVSGAALKVSGAHCFPPGGMQGGHPAGPTPKDAGDLASLLPAALGDFTCFPVLHQLLAQA